MKENPQHSRRITFRSMAMILAFILAAALAFGCAGEYARKRAEHYYLQGQALVNRGETERAIKKFEKSIYLSEKTGFTAGIAHNLNELAIIHTRRGQFDTARSELNRALDIYRSLGMRPEVSKTINNLAQTYLRQGRAEEALRQYENLIAWDEKTENHLGIAISLWNMARIYDHQLGDRPKALEAYKRSVYLFKKTGNEHYLQRLQKQE